MNLLVTGASGFVGQALTPKLLARGYRVYGLSRHPPIGSRDLIPIIGDITEPNLGLRGAPKDIAAVYHLAGLHSLGEDKDGSIWETNVEGTKNVLDFCTTHKIPRLFFTSTAYTQGRNTYERSKARCELLLQDSDIPVTVFKPSIIMGTKEHPYPGHFAQFTTLVARIHRRVELIRRKTEGLLRLPVIEPLFRIKGNPQGRLNLIPVSKVIEAMANIDTPGVYWLTNATPPILSDLVSWIGEVLLLNLRIKREFRATPIEAQFIKMAGPFKPYLDGDEFPSDIGSYPITKEFIQWVVLDSLLKR